VNYPEVHRKYYNLADYLPAAVQLDEANPTEFAYEEGDPGAGVPTLTASLTTDIIPPASVPLSKYEQRVVGP
jgi:hypothetical protein